MRRARRYNNVSGRVPLILGYPQMGIDLVDCCIRIEREFDLGRGSMDIENLDGFSRQRGRLIGVTAQDVARWVERCIVAAGRTPPPDLWLRVRNCIAATVLAEPEEVEPTSRIIEDLGFT
jgi:hypothetical protein